MSNYISIDSQWGALTFDLDQPLLFKNQTFATKADARAELATLDERSFPLLRQASSGEWAILVHCQERLSESR